MTVYYNGGGWHVSDRLIRTPKKSFALEKLEAVSLKRSFFHLTALPAICGLALVALWWRYLFPMEIATVGLLSIAALVASFQFGTLKVEAIAIRDEEGGTVYGWFSKLAVVRDAIEEAMQDQHHKDVGDR